MHDNEQEIGVKTTLTPGHQPNPAALAAAAQYMRSDAEEQGDTKLVDAISKALAALQRSYTIAGDGTLELPGSTGSIYATRGDFCQPRGSKAPCKGWLASQKAKLARGCYHCVAFELLCLAQEFDT